MTLLCLALWYRLYILSLRRKRHLFLGRPLSRLFGTMRLSVVCLASELQNFSACHTSTHVDDCALRLHQRWSLRALCVLVGSTIGDCTFPATAASVWNSLPESVRSSPSLQVFRSRLKSENRTFCPVLQTWLRTSHCADYYYVTSLFKLIVTCPCSTPR